MSDKDRRTYPVLLNLYMIYKWSVYYPVLVLSTLLFGMLATLLAFTVSVRLGSFLGGVVWARLLGYVTPIIVTVRGKENIDKKQSYVIVSNHLSHYDILVLYGWLGIDFKWVMKKELRKIPGLGIGCETIGHIFIDRSDHQAALASLEAAKATIVNGTSIIFFPEGTRQTGPQLGSFKKGAFRMAIDMKLPILPVTLIGTNKVLPAHSQDLFPGKITMIVHKPIETSQYSEETLPELIEQTRSTIASVIPA